MSNLHHYFRPQKDGPTRKVWEIADEITLAYGRQAARQDVLERASRAGINAGTAATQYNAWRVSYEKTNIDGVNEAPVAPLHLHLQMGADGRILIPAEMRRAMKIDESGKLNAELVDGELRLFSPKIALEKIQKYMQAHAQGGSMVDELLAERRAEATQE